MTVEVLDGIRTQHSRNRATRSCFLCLHGVKHRHCPNCKIIMPPESKGDCGICGWERGHARTNHTLLDPIVHLVQEIFNP